MTPNQPQQSMSDANIVVRDDGNVSLTPLWARLIGIPEVDKSTPDRETVTFDHGNITFQTQPTGAGSTTARMYESIKVTADGEVYYIKGDAVDENLRPHERLQGIDAEKLREAAQAILKHAKHQQNGEYVMDIEGEEATVAIIQSRGTKIPPQQQP